MILESSGTPVIANVMSLASLNQQQSPGKLTLGFLSLVKWIDSINININYNIFCFLLCPYAHVSAHHLYGSVPCTELDRENPDSIILLHIMMLSGMEQKLSRLRSLPNSARKLTEQLCSTLSGAFVASSLRCCVLLRVRLAISHTHNQPLLNALQAKQIDPIVCLWLIKYGWETRFSLSHSAVGPQQLTRKLSKVQFEL